MLLFELYCPEILSPYWVSFNYDIEHSMKYHPIHFFFQYYEISGNRLPHVLGNAFAILYWYERSSKSFILNL